MEKRLAQNAWDESHDGGSAEWMFETHMWNFSNWANGESNLSLHILLHVMHFSVCSAETLDHCNVFVNKMVSANTWIFWWKNQLIFALEVHAIWVHKIVALGSNGTALVAQERKHVGSGASHQESDSAWQSCLQQEQWTFECALLLAPPFTGA